ncbi:MAG: AMP-binding protein [Christensenellaceae bacterium]|nr:AMP-binding protein [Christensenellaceae bacterium]
MKNNIASFLMKYADEKPDKLALVDDKNNITYGQLFKRATELSKKYTTKNKGYVVKAERNIETIIDFYAILLSGNYYVPVDPQIPREKLDYITETIKTNNYENTLYIMFTSGSTGLPKGVVKSHENYLAFVHNFIKTFNLTSDEIIANQTPFNFDASAKDILVSLALCATLVIVPKMLFMFPNKLIGFLNEHKVSAICWVPSALIIIVKLKTLETIKPQFIKKIFFVGEVFPIKYLNLLIAELPNVDFINLYGLTEIAGVCLYYKIPKNKILKEDTALPMGLPLLNNKVYLDENGEVCVESEQVALGYTNNHEKNKEVFVNGMLKTGDFARIDDNNNFIFVTRKDFQIKHMGYRLELQEIETFANAIEYVDACACLYDKANEKIVLFLVLSKSRDDPKKEIILDLRKKLPAYMIPNVIEILDTMPQNANGKIDRNNLQRRINKNGKDN